LTGSVVSVDAACVARLGFGAFRIHARANLCTRKRGRKMATKPGGARATRARSGTSRTARTKTYKCPECDRTFSRPQALGAHRRQAHGVVGTSKRTKSRAAAAARSGHAQSTGTTATRASRRGRSSANLDGGSRGSSASQSQRSRGTQQRVDRDALLNAVFPSGIPARENVIRDVGAWLDEAERLSRAR
jgi:C2H2-type zinc finger